MSIKIGTAQRIGLRRPGPPAALAYIQTPGDVAHLLAVVGSRGIPTYVDGRGSAVRGPEVVITADMIKDTRVAGKGVGP